MVRGKTATTFVDATRPPPLEPVWNTAFLMEPTTVSSMPSVSGTVASSSRLCVKMEPATVSAPSVSGTETAKSIAKSVHVDNLDNLNLKTRRADRIVIASYRRTSAGQRQPGRAHRCSRV